MYTPTMSSRSLPPALVPTRFLGVLPPGRVRCLSSVSSGWVWIGSDRSDRGGRIQALSQEATLATLPCSGMSAAVVRLVPAGQEVAPEDPELSDFLQQVQQLQADMSAMTGEDHIARLFRPGAKYFNMNPFEVLGLSHKASVDEVKSTYRKMSIKVHPDKNPGNERAQTAFEIVKAAAERLEDEERYSFCVRICQAAEDAAVKKVHSAKKKLRKEGQARTHIGTTLRQTSDDGQCMTMIISRQRTERTHPVAPRHRTTRSPKTIPQRWK